MSRALGLPEPLPAELAELAAKYRRLSELRVNGDQSPADARGPMRALSAQFPGSLREIDVLALSTLEARAQALESAAAGEVEVAAWGRAVHAYHRLMALCLWLKPQLKAAQAAGEASCRVLCAEGYRRFGVQIPGWFLSEVSRPPGGRLNRLVFEVIDESLGLPAGGAAELIFPRESVHRAAPSGKGV